MKYLKNFNEAEKATCGMDIMSFVKGTHVINSDGTIDVDGSVDFSDWNSYTTSPLSLSGIKFGKVSGYFNCEGNGLTTLEGCPEYVGRYFDCGDNSLTSLEGSPEIVGGDFSCSENLLTTLKGCPKEVSGDFACSENKLISLEGSPEIVGGDLWCYNNKLTSLVGSPISVNGHFYCYNNNLYDFYGLDKVEYRIICNDNPVFEIYELCPTNEFIEYLNEFRPIRGKTILGKRLQECLYMCDKDIDVTNIKFENYTLLE